MQKDVIRSKRVLTMLSQMCDRGKKLNTKRYGELDKQKLADRAKEFGVKSFQRLWRRKSLLTLLSKSTEAKLGYEFFSKLKRSIFGLP